MSCPRCGQSTVTADLNGIQVERCAACRSVWCDEGWVETLREPEQSWTERINQHYLAQPPERVRALGERLQGEGLERGIWIEDDGRRRGITLALRPRLMDLSCRGYIHHVCWQLRMAVRRVARLCASEPAAAAIMALEAGEDEWVARYRAPGTRYADPRGERIFCRLDALGSLEGAGWQQRLKFMEVNVVGIGGMTYTPPAEELLLQAMDSMTPGPAQDMAFDVNHDPRALLLDELREHARVLGVSGAPAIALVDDLSRYTLGGELGRLLAHYRSLGVDAIYCDPREIELSRGGEVVARGRKVDVIYRFIEIRDLVEMERRGEPLHGLRAAFEGGAVVPGAGGEFEHKSCFELLTDPIWRAAFTPELRRVIADHVLWTRLLRERVTTDPRGSIKDLVAFARAKRETLVLKPNRGAGGEGVVLGGACDAGAWDEALSLALAVPDSHVIQEAAPADVEPFPVIGDDDQVRLRPYFCASGFFPGRRGLAVFGRHSENGVVNIQSGGGISPFLVSLR